VRLIKISLIPILLSLPVYGQDVVIDGVPFYKYKQGDPPVVMEDWNWDALTYLYGNEKYLVVYWEDNPIPTGNDPYWYVREESWPYIAPTEYDDTMLLMLIIKLAMEELNE